MRFPGTQIEQLGGFQVHIKQLVDFQVSIEQSGGFQIHMEQFGGFQVLKEQTFALRKYKGTDKSFLPTFYITLRCIMV